MQRNVYWFGAREYGVGGVVLVKRGEDDHLLSRVADGHHRDHHRLGTAARDYDIPVRIDLDPHAAGLLRRERGAKPRRTPRYRKLMRTRAAHALERVGQFPRRRKIGEPLREVYCSVLVRQPRHAADNRFGEVLEPFVQRAHVRHRTTSGPGHLPAGTSTGRTSTGRTSTASSPEARRALRNRGAVARTEYRRAAYRSSPTARASPAGPRDGGEGR